MEEEWGPLQAGAWESPVQNIYPLSGRDTEQHNVLNKTGPEAKIISFYSSRNKSLNLIHDQQL